MPSAAISNNDIVAMIIIRADGMIYEARSMLQQIVLRGLWFPVMQQSKCDIFAAHPLDEEFFFLFKY